MGSRELRGDELESDAAGETEWGSRCSVVFVFVQQPNSGLRAVPAREGALRRSKNAISGPLTKCRVARFPTWAGRLSVALLAGSRAAAAPQARELHVEGSKVRVHSSPTRCPFCHDTCDATGEDVVCHDCLARHHSECWSENGAACAACSSPAALVVQTAPASEAQVTGQRAAQPVPRVSRSPRGMTDAELAALAARQRIGSRFRIAGSLLAVLALVLLLFTLGGARHPRIPLLFLGLIVSGPALILAGLWLGAEPRVPRSDRNR